jgi:hypothetical protein
MVRSYHQVESELKSLGVCNLKYYVGLTKIRVFHSYCKKLNRGLPVHRSGPNRVTLRPSKNDQ